MSPDTLNLLKEPALILLGILLLVVVLYKDRFSKIGRDSTNKIFIYTAYTVFAIAIITFAIPILNKEVGSEYTIALIFSIAALKIVADYIKAPSIEQDKKTPSPSIDNKSIQTQQYFTETNSSIKNKPIEQISSNNKKSIDIQDEIENLLLYKKAIISGSYEDWSNLLNLFQEKTDLKVRSKIIKLAIQEENIKNNISYRIRMLSDLGNTYLDDNNPLKAIDAFENSLSLNTQNISSVSLVYDSIGLGKAYTLMDRKEEAKVMFQKAYNLYIEVSNTNNIEAEDISSIKDALSQIPMLPKVD
jgi:tetratricopeptide (TPR) repeat protein